MKNSNTNTAMNTVEIRITVSKRVVMVTIGAITLSLDINKIENNIELINSIIRLAQESFKLKKVKPLELKQAKAWVEYIKVLVNDDSDCTLSYRIDESGKVRIAFGGQSSFNFIEAIVLLDKFMKCNK